MRRGRSSSLAELVPDLETALEKYGLATRFKDRELEDRYFTWNIKRALRRLYLISVVGLVIMIASIAFYRLQETHSDWSAGLAYIVTAINIISIILFIVARRWKSVRIQKIAFYISVTYGFSHVLSSATGFLFTDMEIYAAPAVMSLVFAVMLSARVSFHTVIVCSVPVPILTTLAYFLTPLHTVSSSGAVAVFLTIGAAPLFCSLAKEQEAAHRAEFFMSYTLEQSLQKSTEENTRLQKELRDLHQKTHRSPSLNIKTPLENVINKLKNLTNNGDDDETMEERIASIVEILQSTHNIMQPVISASASVLDDGDKAVSNWLMKEYDVKSGSSNSTVRNRKHKGATRKSSAIDVICNEVDELSLCMEMSSKELQEVFANLCDWDAFDLQKVQDLTNNSPLQAIAMIVFLQFDLLSAFEISASRLSSFLSAIEKEYNPVPYHNSTHASDVLQGVSCMLSHPSVRAHFSDLDLLGCLFAAIIHDVGHGGCSNSYEVATMSSIALLHNDRSVWENHHLHKAFSLLSEDRFNFLSSLNIQDKRQFRKTVINCVMATDMAHHFDGVGAFKAQAASGRFSSSEGRQVLMNMTLHISDISNPARREPVYMHWVSRVMEEFYQQGDRERAADLPISTFMDRTKPQLKECQRGFLDFIVLPTYTAWTDVFPELPAGLTNARSNRKRWDADTDIPSK